MFLFFKKILISTVILILIGAFPFLSWGVDFWLELLIAFSISLLNAIIGYYLVLISINKNNADFFKIVYGGMLIRMIFVFGFSIYLILNKFVATVPYMLFLMLFYVIHQWTEIAGWLKELPVQNMEFKA